MKNINHSSAAFCMQPQLFPSTHGQRQKPDVLRRIKDPGSAITHGIGFVLSFIAAIPLISLAIHSGDIRKVIAMSVFSLSMMALYAASTCYHAFHGSEKAQTLRKKIDHMMIFVLIAGSYTPVCMLTLWEGIGKVLLALVWGIAAAGMILKLFWVYCPRWVSSVLYIGMGWVCILAFPQLWNNLSAAQFGWLLAGGIIYTIGGVIYALKLSIFNDRHPCFGSHEIFHLFVMGGSLCHFIVMFLLV